MSGAVHTPGPWVARRYCGKEDSWFVRGANDERVCGSGSGPVSEYDARLIAAAPELLEVVKCMAKFDGRNNNAALKEMARAAIAKVTGNA